MYLLCTSDNDECPVPRTSSAVKYCSGSSGDICKLECPSNRQLFLPAPKYIPCSELGVYTPLKPQEKNVLPSCGGKSGKLFYENITPRNMFGKKFFFHLLHVK